MNQNWLILGVVVIGIVIVTQTDLRASNFSFSATLDTLDKVQWNQDTIQFFIIDEISQPIKVQAVVDAFTSTSSPSPHKFEGWQGVFNYVNTNYPDNNIPDKFERVFSENNADIVITLSPISNEAKLGTASLSIINNQIISASITFHNSDDIRSDVLATVGRHEIGHVLGLAHSETGSPFDLMNDKVVGRNTLIDRMNIEELL